MLKSPQSEENFLPTQTLVWLKVCAWKDMAAEIQKRSYNILDGTIDAILADDASALFSTKTLVDKLSVGVAGLWQWLCSVSLSTTYRDRFESYAKSTYKLSYPNSSTRVCVRRKFYFNWGDMCNLAFIAATILTGQASPQFKIVAEMNAKLHVHITPIER